MTAGTTIFAKTIHRPSEMTVRTSHKRIGPVIKRLFLDPCFFHDFQHQPESRDASNLNLVPRIIAVDNFHQLAHATGIGMLLERSLLTRMGNGLPLGVVS